MRSLPFTGRNVLILPISLWICVLCTRDNIGTRICKQLDFSCKALYCSQISQSLTLVVELFNLAFKQQGSRVYVSI